MERIKLGKSIYDLAINGASFGEDKAKLVFIWPEGKSFEQIEADLTGNDRIVILDESGETIESRTGYPYLDRLTKQHDYIVGMEQIEDGTDPEIGETLWKNQDVTGTVMIATLKKADVWQELARIGETVDMLILTELGV